MDAEGRHLTDDPGELRRVIAALDECAGRFVTRGNMFRWRKRRRVWQGPPTQPMPRIEDE